MAVNVGQRNVPDTPANQQLEAIDLALELVLHTLKITRNKNIFTDEYKDLTDDIIQCAKDIYIYAWDANGEYVRADHKDRWPERNRKQLKAISRCNRLFALTVAKAKRGEITKAKADECYRSWKANASKGTSYKLLQRMDLYYKSLWEDIE